MFKGAEMVPTPKYAMLGVQRILEVSQYVE